MFKNPNLEYTRITKIIRGYISAIATKSGYAHSNLMSERASFHGFTTIQLINGYAVQFGIPSRTEELARYVVARYLIGIISFHRSCRFHVSFLADGLLLA